MYFIFYHYILCQFVYTLVDYAFLISLSTVEEEMFYSLLLQSQKRLKKKIKVKIHSITCHEGSEGGAEV